MSLEASCCIQPVHFAVYVFLLSDESFAGDSMEGWYTAASPVKGKKNKTGLTLKLSREHAFSVIIFTL